LTEAPARFVLAFWSGPERLDYSRRLSRLRWRRAFTPERAVEVPRESLARGIFSCAERWLFVRDETALPLPGAAVPDRLEGRVLLASGGVTPDPPLLHTLRELEESTLRAAAPDLEEPSGAPAILFRAADFPPSGTETAGEYVERLAASPTPRAADARFGALRFDDPHGRERPEVTRHLPGSMRRLLDVGCGAGAASGALKERMPGLAVIGIERDARAAARALERLDRVLEGDAAEALRRLVSEGERFDAFLFADLLEHLEDPIAALSHARALAGPGATLVASVPNVGHLSLTRDLVLGRFDPVPAGLADAGHLRWFTRSSLRAALEEAGWEVLSIEPVPGAPAPEGEAFLSWLAVWPGADRESLTTYQWVAVARLGSDL